MTVHIAFRALHANAPNQNAGVFIGTVRMSGFDTNVKQNSGHGATYGFGQVEMGTRNMCLDGYEWVDGVIADRDVKITFGGNA